MFTPEELAAISRYIDDGERTEATASAIEKVFYAEGQIRMRLVKENAALGSRLEKATAKIARFEERKQEAILQGEFAETGLDSVEVARCLLYYLQQKQAWRMSKSKLQYILFEVYAAWLAGHKERIFIEHPVCTEYGPMFWRVFKQIENLQSPLSADCVRTLGEKNPGVVAICKNAAAKYYDYGDSQLKSYLLKCPAYKEAMPQKNNGKWNGLMQDALILAWKQDQNRG